MYNSEHVIICEKCGGYIEDPELCWCGDFKESHTYVQDHMFVPMGCTCHFNKSPIKKVSETKYGCNHE